MAQYDADPDRDFLASGAPRCHAAVRSGDRCGQPALVGQNICRLHGGKTPKNLATAERRLLDQAARRMLAKWDPDPTPVDDPIASLKRVIGQAEALKDRAYAACAPMRPCPECGRDETDPSAFLGFNMVAKNLNTMLQTAIKSDLQMKMLEHDDLQFRAVLAAVNDALEHLFPDVDATRVLLQYEIVGRLLTHYEQHPEQIPAIVRTQSRAGSQGYPDENPTFGRDTSGDYDRAMDLTWALSRVLDDTLDMRVYVSETVMRPWDSDGKPIPEHWDEFEGFPLPKHHAFRDGEREKYLREQEAAAALAATHTEEEHDDE